MDHIAIMNPKRKLIDKILSGDKTIESRRYQTKRAPWNNLNPWDIVYFKDSGKAITAKATIAQVKQFDNLHIDTIREIVHTYGEWIFLQDHAIEQRAHTKKYCILVFLDSPELIEPFHINKTWFGMANAWLCVDDIKKIRL